MKLIPLDPQRTLVRDDDRSWDDSFVDDREPLHERCTLLFDNHDPEEVTS